MTDKFTLRDFLVYFTTGSLTVISLSVLFFKPLFDETSLFLANHMYIKEFSSLLIVLLIPLLYFIGHIIHGIDYQTLKSYKFIHKKLTKKGWRKCFIIEWIRIFLHFVMYKNRVIESILNENKKNKTWKSEDFFWIDCAILQKDGTFSSAEYWYTLNDLFKGLTIIFLLSFIIAFLTCQIIIGIFFFGLYLICNFRAMQFAEFFVQTVKRLINQQTTTP